VPLQPPFATVPLLSPPLAAVIWRPLALLPGVPVMVLWWAGGFVALTGSVLATVRGGGVLRNGMALVLSPWLALTAWSGNLNCYLVAMLIGAFWLSTRGRNGISGSLIAVATFLKVTPGIYLFWLIVRRDRSGILGFAITSAALVVVSLLGAGLQAHFDYLSVIRATGTGGVTDISLPGILINAGLDPSLAQLAIPVIGVWAVAAAWQARRHAGVSFSAATLGAVFTQPSLGLHSLSLLLPGVTPYGARAGTRPNGAALATADARTPESAVEPVPSPS
jgi:alpha-1,2-mannosyltransferase